MKNFFLILFTLAIFSVAPRLIAQKETEENTVDITISSPASDLKINVIDKRADAIVPKKAETPTTTNAKSAEEKANNTIWPDLKSLLSDIQNRIHDYIKYDKFSLWDVCYLFVGILTTLMIGRTVRWFLENHAKKFATKTKTKIDDIIFHAIGRPISLLIFSIGLFFSAWPLTTLMSPILKEIFGRVCLALAATAIAWGIYRLIEVIDYTLKCLAEKTTNNLDDMIVAVIRKALKITIAIASILFIGQNILNLNITTLLAGAGVMGLAVAFAAQDTIANFFGSIMIILDQPFKAGDCILISGYKGSVENVGFRSTKVRTFDGHLVSLPNKSVANTNIENITKRPFIKHVINLGLTYDTGYKNMKKAIDLLHKLLDSQDCMNKERLPRIVFNSFNDFSLNISITVWWHHRDKDGNFTTPDYTAFMKWIHKTDMEILKIFDAEGLEFAFPTNTTYLAYDEKRKLKFSVDKKL